MDGVKYNFIVVDDSKLDCFVAEKVIKHSGKALVVKSFLEPIKALEYIKRNEIFNTSKTIIILDIQMPVMTGHQFVEAFEQLSQEIQDRYIVYMISSSSNESDLNRIANYKSVRKFSNKPINKEMINGFLRDLK
ncbi:MAG: chemotaxis-specific methylesterase [Sphingobacteriales bacterium]|nr:chemotaxis-specific methylesterase [Sphingobacteriales bacterium]